MTWLTGLARRGRLLTIVDLTATLIFAVEGAGAAATANLDVFGLLVLAFVTALGGGLIRDLILGEHPPAAFRSRGYLALCVLGSLAVFIVYKSGGSLPSGALNVLDAAGLALFCVAGADKALDYGFNGSAAIILGALTGSGGGMVRDVLLNKVPVVLNAHIYAVAALAGAATVVGLIRAGASKTSAMGAGFAVCFTLRVLSIAFDWNLPHVRS